MCSPARVRQIREELAIVAQWDEASTGSEHRQGDSQRLAGACRGWADSADCPLRDRWLQHGAVLVFHGLLRFVIQQKP
jgi:hypothetical protein